MLGPYTYTVETVPSNGGHEVRVRLDSNSGCLRDLPDAQLDIVARSLQLVLYSTDGVLPGCATPTPAYVSFGVVPRGTYSFTGRRCIDNPIPGQPFCTNGETFELMVAGGEPMAVPMATDLGLAFLLGILLVIAGRRLA